MKRLHSEIIQKLLLLKKLMDTQGTWTKADTLSNQIGLSTFTTRELIKNLAVDFRENEIGAQLEMIKQRGVLLENCDHIQFSKLRKILVTDSIEYNLIKHFFSHNITNYYNYCTEYHISMPTLRRRLNEINEAVGSYGIKLWKNAIEGDERIIRSFLTQYFYEIHSGSCWPFSQSDRETILHLISQMERNFGFSLTKESKELLAYLWTVSKIRRENQNFIKIPIYECVEFCSNNPYFSVFTDIYSPLIAKNKYFQNEMEYLFYSFFSMHIDFKSISPQHLENLTVVMEKPDCQYTTLGKLFLNSLEERLYIDNLNVDKDILQIEIYLACKHAWLFPFRVDFVAEQSHFEYIVDIQKKYPELIGIINLFYEQIQHKKDIDIDYRYIVEYMAIVIHSYKSIARFGKKIRISIQARLGQILEGLIISQIQN